MKQIVKTSIALLISLLVGFGLTLSAYLGGFDYLEREFYQEASKIRYLQRLETIQEQISSYITSLDNVYTLLDQSLLQSLTDRANTDIGQARINQIAEIERLLASEYMLRWRIVLDTGLIAYSNIQGEYEDISGGRNFRRRIEDVVPLDNSGYEFFIDNPYLFFQDNLIISRLQDNLILQLVVDFDKILDEKVLGPEEASFFIAPNSIVFTELEVDALLFELAEPEESFTLIGSDEVFGNILQIAKPGELNAVYLLASDTIRISETLKIIVIAAAFLTIFLISFLLLNAKQDPNILLSDRIRRFQLEFIQQYLKDKDRMNWASLVQDLRSKESAVLQSVTRGLGRFKRKNQDKIEETVSHSWNEVLDLIEERQSPAKLDEKAIENIIARTLKAHLPDIVSSIPQKIPSRVDDLEKIGSAEEVLEEVEEIGDAEEVLEEVEEIGDAEEVLEEVEEIGDAEEVLEEVEEIGDAEEVLEEVEEIADAEEALEEVEEIGEAEEVLEEIEEAASVEDVLEEVQERAASEEEFEEVEEIAGTEEVLEQLNDDLEIAEEEISAVAQSIDENKEAPVDELELEELSLEDIGTGSAYSTLDSAIIERQGVEYELTEDQPDELFDIKIHKTEALEVEETLQAQLASVELSTDSQEELIKEDEPRTDELLKSTEPDEAPVLTGDEWDEIPEIVTSYEKPVLIPWEEETEKMVYPDEASFYSYVFDEDIKALDLESLFQDGYSEQSLPVDDEDMDPEEFIKSTLAEVSEFDDSIETLEDDFEDEPLVGIASEASIAAAQEILEKEHLPQRLQADDLEIVEDVQDQGEELEELDDFTDEPLLSETGVGGTQEIELETLEELSDLEDLKEVSLESNVSGIPDDVPESEIEELPFVPDLVALPPLSIAQDIDELPSLYIQDDEVYELESVKVRYDSYSPIESQYPVSLTGITEIEPLDRIIVKEDEKSSKLEPDTEIEEPATSHGEELEDIEELEEIEEMNEELDGPEELDDELEPLDEVEELGELDDDLDSGIAEESGAGENDKLWTQSIVTISPYSDYYKPTEVIQENSDGTFNLSDAAYSAQEPEGELKDLVNSVSGESSQFDFEDIIPIQEADLDVEGIGLSVQKPARTKPFEAVEHGFDYDAFLRKFKQGDIGIMKSLMTVSRKVDALFAAILQEEEKGFRAEYSIGMAKETASSFNFLPHEDIVQKVLKPSNLLYITKGYTRIPSIDSKVAPSDKQYLSGYLFMPIQFNGEQRILAFGLRSVRNDLQSHLSLLS
jgi:hypothetical protein